MLNRAIDVQSLIGTIGGYIGLFLGYGMLQISMEIITIGRKLENWYSRIRSGTNEVTNIELEVAQPRYMDTILNFESRKNGAKR